MVFIISNKHILSKILYLIKFLFLFKYFSYPSNLFMIFAFSTCTFNFLTFRLVKKHWQNIFIYFYNVLFEHPLIFSRNTNFFFYHILIIILYNMYLHCFSLVLIYLNKASCTIKRWWCMRIYSLVTVLCYFLLIAKWALILYILFQKQKKHFPVCFMKMILILYEKQRYYRKDMVHWYPSWI